MPIYTDAEGNEVELPFTPEEATAAKERIDGLPSDEDREAADKETAELKAKAEKADEAEKRYDEALTKLNKLEKKDFDFNSFRNKTQKEKDSLLSTFDKKEREWIQVADSSKSEIEELKGTMFQEYTDEALDKLVGGDDELRAELQEAAKQFVGEPKTRKEVSELYHNAYIMVKGAKPSINPLNTTGFGGDRTTTGGKAKRYTDTEAGKSNYNKYFPDSPSSKK